MFSVSEDFLKEEIREGFTVPEMMKRAWAAELKTLNEIDRVCKRHGIKYFAFYGSLLGAVRHKGFIPWDDDIDICMLPEDYMKFLEVSSDFPAPYRVKSFYSDKPFTQFHIVVSNSREEKLSYDKDRIQDFFGCPFIVGIDVYRLDYLPRDPDLCKLMELMYYMGYSLSMDYENKGIDKDFLKLLNLFSSRLGREFDIDSPGFITEIRRATDAIAMHCSSEDSDHVGYFPQYAYAGNCTHFPKEYYKDSLDREFENIKIPVPVDYDKVLKMIYGEQYMTPVQSFVGHDYPFYKGQLEYFKYIGAME